MPLTRVSPDDPTQIDALIAIQNAAQAVDDPEGLPQLSAGMADHLRYGWDLHPDEAYLYTPDGATDPVATLLVDLPLRDNLDLFWLQVEVHPDHRRRGHGTAVMTEALHMAEAAGRHIVWVETVEDDAGARKFAERFGFAYASHDARRRQVLAEVDQARVARLFAEAEAAAADYVVERLLPPVAEETLQQMVEVTAAINDAPMGTLTFEDEVFDLDRMRDLETARERKGDRSYRVVARHRVTGEIGGHTQLVVSPHRPLIGFQADTAVSRAHRGHRLGLLLKIEALRWLAEAEPQIERVETWNNADNRFMISVNELLDYRLSGTFATYELTLPAPDPGRAGQDGGVTFLVPAEAYGRFMGRFSEPLAPVFADACGVRAPQRALDVGCGPGALTAELVRRLGAGSVTAVDPSPPFVAAAAERFPAVEIHTAAAEDLPFADDTFDVALAQLVVHFMADPVRGLAEMGRVTRPGGLVGACVWDFGEGGSPLSVFWRAAREVDPSAPDESGRPGTREGQLADLAHQAGLSAVEPGAVSVTVPFATFDAWWQPFGLGVGPVGAYVRGLDPDLLAALRDRAAQLLPPAPFTVTASAWSVTARA